MLELCRAIETDLMFGYRTADSYDDEMFPPATRDLNLPIALRRPGLRVLSLAVAFARQQRTVSEYETRIFSGSCAPFAAPPPSTGRNIFYCHTPPRFLYDRRHFYANRLSGIGSPFKTASLALFRSGYETAVGRMDLIVANSRTIQARVRKYLNRDTTIVYPPCDTEAFVWQGQEGYYLSTARLSPLKRVDKIVEAFVRMPKRKLVVASHGEEFDRLRTLAGSATNITFLGWVSEPDLRKLMGEAIATIYVPVDEDFGMSPVEGMAAGKPCIGVAEGGLLETIVDGETGVLLEPNFTIEDLIEAVHGLTPERALSMRQACEARADQFTRRTFIERMREIIRPQ